MRKPFPEYKKLFKFELLLPTDVSEHLSAMKSLHSYGGARPEQQMHEALFNHLYECLSIIDQKSASLFTGNSVLAAVFSIFLWSTADISLEKIWLGGGLLLMLVSSLLLIPVIMIHWSTTEELTKNSSEYLKRLIGIRDERTVFYRYSLAVSFLSLVNLVIFVFVKLIGEICSSI